MSPRKHVLTTGEVAKICNVAPRTVSKWVDSGQLRGYRIPGSKDRRIPHDQLVRFMRAHGIPLNELDTGVRRVLVLDVDRGLCDVIRKTLVEHGGYQVSAVESSFEAGAALVELRPHLFLIDISLSDVIPRAIARYLRSTPDLRHTALWGMARGMSEAQGQALLQDGFAGFLAKPFTVRALLEKIERAVAAQQPSDGAGQVYAPLSG